MRVFHDILNLGGVFTGGQTISESKVDKLTDELKRHLDQANEVIGMILDKIRWAESPVGSEAATGAEQGGSGGESELKLSRKAAKVWKYLEKFREKNSCDPTYDDITANPPDGLKMGRQTVSQAYKELRAAGFSVPGKTKKN